MPTKIKVAAKDGGEEGKATVVKAPDRYTAWGSEAGNAQGEGWTPAGWNSEGTTVFRNSYNPGANTISIPGDKNYGHLAAIGYKNGMFDLVIRDSNNNVKQTIKKGVAPNDIRSYFSNQSSPIQQRVNTIQAGTNPDRAGVGGGYAALYNPNLVR